MEGAGTVGEVQREKLEGESEGGREGSGNGKTENNRSARNRAQRMHRSAQIHIKR